MTKRMYDVTFTLEADESIPPLELFTVVEAASDVDAFDAAFFKLTRSFRGVQVKKVAAHKTYAELLATVIPKLEGSDD